MPLDDIQAIPFHHITHSCTELSHFWAGFGTEPNVTSCWLPSQLLDSRLMQVSRLFIFAMPPPFLNTQGIPIPEDKIIRNGSSAVVVLHNGMAVKTPLRYIWSSECDVEVNIQSIRSEQDIYRRLQCPEDSRFKGIVHCIEFTAEATQLAYMANGDLRSCLA